MDRDAQYLFKRILETPSPSGYEWPLQEIVREYVGRFADEVSTDVHGNVIAVKNPERPAAGDAGRPLRPDRPDRPAHRRRRVRLRPADRRLGPADAHRPADDRLDRRRAGLRRHRPKADPPADRRGTQAGAEDEGPVARHRRGQQGGGPEAGPHRRPGHRRTRLPRGAQQPGRLARPWTTRPASGSSIEALRRATKEKLRLRGSTPSRPCRRKSACAAPRPAPSASIRTSASPST